MTRVRELMTRRVHTAAPTNSLTSAAQAMSDLDIDLLPVCDGRRLVGVVTRRDIRALLERSPLGEYVLGDIMIREARWCYEDTSVAGALKKMSEQNIDELPVINRRHQLVGMFSLRTAGLWQRSMQWVGGQIG